MIYHRDDENETFMKFNPNEPSFQYPTFGPEDEEKKL